MDGDKVRAFIEQNGITACPPMLAEDAYRQAGAVAVKTKRARGPRDAIDMCPEVRLACAKILSMLCDLGGRCAGAQPEERHKVRDDAHRWFFGRSDFELWCETAGYDPEYVRRKAREVFENGLPQLRAKAGKGKLYHERRAYRLRRETGP